MIRVTGGNQASRKATWLVRRGNGIDYEQMSLQVFISYSGYDDQLIAHRLQTLATVYGAQAYVPPATTRSGAGTLAPSVQREIEKSDLVLAVANREPSPATAAELNHASRLSKLVIPIVGQWVNPNFLQSFPKGAFMLDPMNPAVAEKKIVDFIQKSKNDKETKQLLIGVAAVAVGLLLLTAVTE